MFQGQKTGGEGHPGLIIEMPENLCWLILYPLDGKQAEAKHQGSFWWRKPNFSNHLSLNKPAQGFFLQQILTISLRALL